MSSAVTLDQAMSPQWNHLRQKPRINTKVENVRKETPFVTPRLPHSQSEPSIIELKKRTSQEDSKIQSLQPLTRKS